MDNRILAAIGALTLTLVGGVGAFFMFSGGGDDTPGVEAPADGAAPVKGGKKGKAGGGGANQVADGDPELPGGGPLKVANDQEKDPDYEQRALEARQKREALNAEWRTESTASAQAWIAANVRDEAKGLQVMAAINKMHDTVAQSRRDMEDGVIHPRVLREEMDMAKADLRVELDNILGADQAAALLEHVKGSSLGGI